MTVRGFVAGWAALGVILTSATQLRPQGGALGPGELLLATWLLFFAFLLLYGLTFNITNSFRIMLVYWMSSWVLIGFGAIVSIAMSKVHSEKAIHDSFAFLLMASFSCLLSLNLSNGGNNYYERLASIAFFMISFWSAFLLVVALISPSLGPVSFWWGYRFRGWAQNPNQMALLILGMPFLGGYLLWRAQRLRHRAAYGLAIACCVWVGWATYSDGLRVAWALALGGLATVAWYRAVFRARGAVMYLSHLVAPILVVALAVTLGDDLVERVLRVSHDIYHGDGGQGDLRTTLWRHGIEAIARSPLVGLGPGSYSGIHGPFGGYEAHNTFIDWGMSTGVLGILLYVGLLGLIGWRALKANAFALLGLVAALTVFGMFSYILRQPICWLLLALSLALTEQRTRAEVRAPMPAPRAARFPHASGSLQRSRSAPTP